MTDPGAPERKWALAINSYLNQPLIPQLIGEPRFLLRPSPTGCFLCPSDKQKLYGAGGSYGYNSSGIHVDVISEGLGLGGRGQPSRQGARYPSAVREPAVQVPSDMIAVGDAYAGRADGRPFDVWESLGYVAREGTSGMMTDVEGLKPTGRRRHQGRLNMAFCDGHVVGVRVQMLYFSRDEHDSGSDHVQTLPYDLSVSISILGKSE